MRRAPILLVLAALVVAAIVFNDRESPSRSVAAVASEADAGPAVPASGALSTSWYCAEGTSTADGRADETVVVASIADTRIDATITVMQGASAAEPVSRTIHLAPRERRRVHVSDVVQAAEPGVVVEVVGGRAVVAHEIVANGDIATEPCARGGAADWYFADGTTLKGAQQYLALFDPFGDDAIVDVSFVTDDGVQEPDALQGLSVPRRSRVSVAVHDDVPRQRDVAVHVHARVGRIVVERSQMFDGTVSSGEIVRKGVALSLGANEPRREWYFPSASTIDGATGTVAVANFGARATAVEVGVALEGDQTATVQSIEIGARSVVTVDRLMGVGPDTRYAVTVAARDAEGRGDPVVAELLEWRSSASPPDVASTMGSTRLARRWVVALPASDGVSAVSVLNPGADAASAELLVYDAGDTSGPPSAPGRAIAAGHLGVFDLPEIGAAGDHVLVVTSNRPVAVGLDFTGSAGAATSAAVPDYA